MRRTSRVLIFGVLALSCARAPKLQEPVGVTLLSAATAAARPAAAPRTSKVVLEIPRRELEACGIPAPDAIEIADPERADELARLATCLASGPMDKSVVALIGRGQPARNDKTALDDALEQALRIQRALSAHGVAASRLLVASARDPKSSPRVQLVVVSGEPAPPLAR
jgi:hypothetical protein